MTTKIVRTCDGCGDEIHEHKEFVVLARGGRKSLVLGSDLEFCDYHCLLRYLEKGGHIARFAERKGK